MRICFIDTETFSEADLKKVGSAKYFEHPSTKTILVTYKLHKHSSCAWQPHLGERDETLDELARDPKVIFIAFNAPFDIDALKKVDLHIPLDRWRCLLVATLALGFQGSLDYVLQRLELPYSKEREGIRLIRKFSKIQPSNHRVRKWSPETAPEDWETFVQYGLTDVDVLEPLYEEISQYGKRVNWDEWQLDQRINNSGLPIDMELVNRVLEIADYEREHLIQRMTDITGLDNPNSKPQIKKWFHEQGLNIPNMQKATIELALTNSHNDSRVQEVLRCQQQISKTSTSKWDKLSVATCADGRMRGTHQYLGAARTGRDAHRQFQPGNLPRGSLEDPVGAADLALGHGREGIELVYGDIMPVLSSILRGAITAPPGSSLAVADLAGIEGRVLPWLAGFDEKLQQIAAGLDMYKVAASNILGTPYDMIDKSARFIGKVAELALGYQGALGALNTMGAIYGASFSEEEGWPIVEAWRDKNAPIVKFWRRCQNAVKLAIHNPGKAKRVGHVEFVVQGDFLFAVLPSGRKLAYHKPKFDSDGFSYMGMDQFSRQWSRLPSYGGKIAENLTQAVARDIFFHGLMEYDRRTLTGEIVLRVHDEMVATVDNANAVQELDIMISSMETVPDWAEGLPLKAEGFLTKRYKKAD